MEQKEKAKIKIIKNNNNKQEKNERKQQLRVAETLTIPNVYTHKRNITLKSTNNRTETIFLHSDTQNLV